MNNVLYLGMADDIYSPMFLTPDFDNLFVICKLDTAFARGDTKQGQREDIIEMLSTGNNKNSRLHAVHAKYGDDTTAYLDEPCEIIDSIVVKEGTPEEHWHLFFMYKGKIRRLSYSYQDFALKEWVRYFNNISTLMKMGAGENRDVIDKPILYKMLKTRCLEDCDYYFNWRYYDDCEIVTTPHPHYRGDIFKHDLKRVLAGTGECY